MGEVHASAYVVDRRAVLRPGRSDAAFLLLRLHVTGYGLFHPVAHVARDSNQEEEKTRVIYLLPRSEEQARQFFSCVQEVNFVGTFWHFISPELAQTIAREGKGRHFECHFPEGMIASNA